MELSNGRKEFGFVPSQVVSDLQDVGNWKTRADAMERLAGEVQQLGPGDVPALRHHLHDLVTFLCKLVGDPNFKISLTTLQVFETLVSRVGRDVQPHVHRILPVLLDKLADNKIVVRQANISVLNRLVQCVKPGLVLDGLKAGLSNSSERVREEVLNRIIHILISQGSGVDPSGVVPGLGLCLRDESKRVQQVALETLAVVHHHLGASRTMHILNSQPQPLDQLTRKQVEERLSSPGLPCIKADGSVEHIVQLHSSTPPQAGAHATPGSTGSPEGGAGAWEHDSQHQHAGVIRASPHAGRRAKLPVVPADSPDITSRSLVDMSPSHSQVGNVTTGRGRLSVPGNINQVQQGSAAAWSDQRSNSEVGGSTAGRRTDLLMKRRKNTDPPSLDLQAHQVPGAGAGGTSGREDLTDLLSCRSDTNQRDHADPFSISGGEWEAGPLSCGPALASGGGGGGGGVPPGNSHMPRFGSCEPATWSGVRSANSRESNESGENDPSTSEKVSLWLPQQRNVNTSVHNSTNKPLQQQHPPDLSSRRQRVDSEYRGGGVLTGGGGSTAEQERGGAGGGGGGGGGGLSTTMPYPSTRPETTPADWLEANIPVVTQTVPPSYPTSRTATSAGQVGNKLNLLKRRQLESRRQDKTNSLPRQSDHLGLGALGEGESDAAGVRSMMSPSPSPASFSGTSTPVASAYVPSRRSPGEDHHRRSPVQHESDGLSGYDPGMSPASASPQESEEGKPAARGRPAQLSLATIKRRQRTESIESNIEKEVSSEEVLALRSKSQTGGPVGDARHFAAGGVATPASFARTGRDFQQSAGGSSGGVGLVGQVDMPSDSLQAVDNPEGCLRAAVRALTIASTAKPMDIDWEAQCQSILNARRLTAHHPEVVLSNMHALILMVLTAVDSLRSYLAKSSCQLVLEMLLVFGTKMDPELEYLVPVLLKKSAENSFLSAEADRVLTCAGESTTESKFMLALVANARHKNPSARASVASHLDKCLALSFSTHHTQDHPGGGGPPPPNLPRCFQAASGRELMEKLFNASVAFLEEGSSETRLMAKRILWRLNQLTRSSGDFEKLLRRVSNDSKAKQVRSIIESREIPEPPKNVKISRGGGSSSRSATMRPRAGADSEEDAPSISPSGAGSGPHSYYPASPSPHPQSGGGGGGWSDGKRRPVRSVKPPSGGSSGPASASPHSVGGTGGHSHYTSSMGAELEELPGLLNLLTSKDWRQRLEGLTSLQDLVLSCPYIPDVQLVSMFDHLVGRLSDGNSKVNLQCLQVLTRIIPALGDSTSCALNTLIPALVTNLGSTNEKIRSAANDAIDTLITNMDSAALLQNFAHCVRNGGARSKHLMLDKLTAVTPEVYVMRPQLVVKHVLPAAFSLLAETKGEIRTANIRLLQTLWTTMGPSLRDHAQSLSGSLQQRFNEAIAIVQSC